MIHQCGPKSLSAPGRTDLPTDRGDGRASSVLLPQPFAGTYRHKAESRVEETTRQNESLDSARAVPHSSRVASIFSFASTIFTVQARSPLRPTYNSLLHARYLEQSWMRTHRHEEGMPY